MKRLRPAAGFQGPRRPLTILGIRLSVIVLVTYWLTLFLATHWSPRWGVLAFGTEIFGTSSWDASRALRLNDKFKHFAAFSCLTFLLCLVSRPTQARLAIYPESPFQLRYRTLLVILLCYAAIDEFTQRYIPRRVPDVWDFVADACGVFTAVAVFATSAFLRQPNRFRGRMTSGGANTRRVQRKAA
ncbi:MAG: VanZ family protein [Planctomycetota bacterium]